MQKHHKFPRIPHSLPHQDALLTKEKDTTHAVMSDLIGWVLQGGILVSSLLILLGLGLLLLQPYNFTTQTLRYFSNTPQQFLHALLTLQPLSLIMLGILVLIVTPVLRVVASILSFWYDHDRQYVVISSALLLLLLTSVLLGGTHGSTGSQHDLHHFAYSPVTAILIFVGAVIAGILGSLVGLGGGVLIVPLLTIVFNLPISFAIGISVISVIATSSGAAAAYVRDHVANIRIGTTLGIATATGATSGALLTGILAPSFLYLLFGLVLFISVISMMCKMGEELPHVAHSDHLAKWLRLPSYYPDHHLQRTISYNVTGTLPGMFMMYIAGMISGLLGIGSGTFKVLALDLLMRLPLKVSTTTSNFMIGVTAAASAGIYFVHGDILPVLAAPVALGTLAGALIGARLLMHMSNKVLRLLFIPVIFIIAVKMVMQGFGL